jgi:solute carrier family 25 carnitine/acylcarnitine transporter 20/29
LCRRYLEERRTAGVLQGDYDLWSKDDPLTFSQGTLTPLLGIGVCVSIQFGVLESTKRYFANQNLLNGKGGEGGRTLSSAQLFSAGVFAGLANGVVSGPVEHIRIREFFTAQRRQPFLNHMSGLQTQSNTKPTYAGPFDAIKKIYSAHGIAGIYKGQTVTLLREATGYGVYFMAYEKLVQWKMEKDGIRRDQISPLNAVLYGATAGYVVRSHLQYRLFPPHSLAHATALGSHIPH